MPMSTATEEEKNERFMQHTPHYRPRGCGVIGIRIMDTKPPPAPYEERMGQMAAHIPFQSFRMRLNQYLKESEGTCVSSMGS